MQHAEKVALVPKNQFDEDREYKRIQRHSATAARSALSLDIKRILKDTDDDDEKVKKYVNALHRYIHVRDTVPSSSQGQSNPITTPKKRDEKTKKKRKTIRGWEQY